MTDEERARIHAAAKAEGMSQWGKPLPTKAVQALRLIAESASRASARPAA